MKDEGRKGKEEGYIKELHPNITTDATTHTHVARKDQR